MDASKILKAVMLQNQINLEIETKGETTMEKAETLELLVDSFTTSEGDLFIELCLDSKQKKAQIELEINHIVKTL
jgi:HKD family nuclease